MEERELERGLKESCGEHVTSSGFERWFYSRDFAPIPDKIKARFNTMPSAVVRPKTPQEVAALLSYCAHNEIPVVPRGGGSSGLFGAVPKKGGIVVDLMGLSQVIEVDRDREIVTTETGITWWELDKRLKGQGLTIRSYPSSAKSATVGGWIMTGGRGIGSLKYGPVFDQVLSMEVALADGSSKEYTPGRGLEWFFESEGMLGIATKVVLQVRAIPEMTSHHLIYFDDIENLFEVLQLLVRTVPRPFSIKIYDHQYLSLLKAVGGQMEDFRDRSGILLVTYDGGREEVRQGEGEMARLIALYQGIEIAGAEREWEHRFNILRIKRAVPSIVPTSVIISLNNLKQFYSGLEKLKKRPIALLGYIVSDNECNALPMVVTDERRSIEYAFAWHTPREISNLALTLGGKPAGGLGVWNAPYKKQLLGEEKIREIRRRKAELDPKGILNPGMWLEPPLFLKAGAYQFAMQMLSILDKMFPTSVGKADERGFAKEVASCVQCGYCMNACPTNQGWISSTPRGRILQAKELFRDRPHHKESITQEYVNRVFQCTLCGRCKVDCTVEIKSPQIWMDLRKCLLKRGFKIEGLELLTNALDETYNIVTKPNDQRANWTKKLMLPYDLAEKKGGVVVYFVGCVTSFFAMTQPIARSFAQILNRASIDFAILGGDEWCCGFPLLAAGMSEASEKYIRHNIDRMRNMGAKSIITTCPGCYRVWKYEYQDVIEGKHPFEVFHSTEFIAKLIEEGKLNLRGLKDTVTYHDPCDLGRKGGVFDEPRYILERIPGLDFRELEDNQQYCHCCGSGGDLLVTNQALSLSIAGRKVEEVLRTGAQTLVTACPSCIRAINMAKTREKANFNVLDITQLVWKSVGS